MSWGPQCLPVLFQIPFFSLPDVLVYTQAPDCDAELKGKDGIDVDIRFFLVYTEDFESISLSVVVAVGVMGPQGLRCSWSQ